MTKLRILLVDDHPVLRAGLKLLINSQADMVVIGETGSGQEAIRQAKASQPDVIVMDISLPDLSGAEATEQIKHSYPQVRVLALTRHGDQGYLRRLLRAGASGYVLKKNRGRRADQRHPHRCDWRYLPGSEPGRRTGRKLRAASDNG